MDLTATHLIASGVVFLIALVFSMLGLGGGMLFVPMFKWLELPLKTVAIPGHVRELGHSFTWTCIRCDLR